MSHPYLEKLEQWETLQQQIKELSRQEKLLRAELVNGAFPDPKEGVNKYELPDGRILKATFKYNRRVDETALPAVRQTLMEELGNEVFERVVNDAFRYKTELSVSTYKKLAPEVKAILDTAIITTPGTPTFEVV